MEKNNIVGDIKTKFNYIKELRSNINDIFLEIKEKLNALDKIYIELINTHKNIDYTFGIDSFYFQNKLIEIEYDNMKSIFNIINNRIYCEYYKLYKMIYTYIAAELKDTILIEKLRQKKIYPIYKDLEPLKTYSFDLIIDIQRNIIETIEFLFNYLTSKESELRTVCTTSEIGINIENLVNFQTYSNTLLNEKINIFCKYLNVFHKHHNKYFSRLLIKCKMMIGIVNEDIHLKKGNNKNLSNGGLQTSGIQTSVIHTSGIQNRVLKRKSTIHRDEERNIKKFMNYENFDENLQCEFNSIISNIPQNDGEENDGEHNDGEHNDGEHNDGEQNNNDESNIYEINSEQSSITSEIISLII
jgi:hypothetical protein